MQAPQNEEIVGPKEVAAEELGHPGRISLGPALIKELLLKGSRFFKNRWPMRTCQGLQLLRIP